MKQFSGRQYLKIDIASSFGLDKKDWEERIAWFDQNHEKLESLVKQADEPAQFLAGVMAYRDMEKGIPIGYACGLDATSSGLQLLSILSGCKKSGTTCNVVSTGHREDAYTKAFQEVNRMLGTQIRYQRKDVKQALMTHLYGSTAVPKSVFGEGRELSAFYQFVETFMPGADQLNRDLIQLWDSNALAHSWTLPDGFEVVIKTMDTKTDQIQFLNRWYDITTKVNQPVAASLSLGANIIHSIDGMVVREMNRRCNYDMNQINEVVNLLSRKGQKLKREKDYELLRLLAAHEMADFMSARVLDLIDEGNVGYLDQNQRNKVGEMCNSLPEKPFPILAIHDCFKFHPNYGNDVRQQYVNILAEIAESSILKSVASQIAGYPINVKAAGNLANDIRNSEYCLA